MTAMLSRVQSRFPAAPSGSAGSDYTEHLGRYKLLRAASGQLTTKLSNQHLSRAAIHGAARDLGMLSANMLVFDSEAEMAVLNDYALFDYRYGPKDKSAVERFISPAFDREAAELTPVQQGARRCKANHRYCLLVITRVVRGVGFFVRDLLRQDADDADWLLTDIAGSGVAEPGARVATRVLGEGDLWFMAGAMLPVADDAVFDEIVLMLEDHFPAGPKGMANLSKAARTDLSRRIIRICLSSGVGQFVRSLPVE